LKLINKSKQTTDLNQKVSIFTIFIIVIISNAYAQEIPEEFFPEARLFDNNSSNEEIAASLDKFKYKRGDLAKVFGYVLDYKSGVKLFLEVKNSEGVVIKSESITPSSGGVFNAFQRISSDVIPGTYVLTIKYDITGIPLSIEFDVEGAIQTLIHIPVGAEFKESGLFFTPSVVSVEEGVPIVWINDDNSVHTVVSGKETSGGRMTSDGRFDSGIFGPDSTFSISLVQGDYDYFCKLHPWLRGVLTVIPSTDPNYVVPEFQEQEDESQIQSSFIDGSDVGFLTIRTENDVYFAGQVVTSHGNVKIRESESPVLIRIYDPSGSLVEIKQVTPNQNNGFSFSITSSGNQYSREGSYTISAQYGLKEYTDETSFILTKKLLSETNYNGYSIYSGAVYYAVPFPERDLEDILFANLLKNPSFDENPPIFNDFHYWSAPYPSFEGELDYAIKTSGDYSYQLSTIAPTEASWSTVASETINVQPGAVYEIEAKTKQENAIQSHINVLYFSNTDNQWYILDYVQAATYGDKDWTKFTKEVTIPEDSNSLRILLNAGWVQDQLRGKATTWFDDIKVRQIATSDYNILVIGNSLEEIKTKIDQSPPVGPYLIESGYNEFDIVMYGGTFYASNQEGILFDTEKLESKENEILLADSLEGIKTKIENAITPPSIEIKIESELEEKQETVIEPDISKSSDTLEKDAIPILQIIVIIAVLSGAAIFVYHSLRKKKTTSKMIKS